MSQIFKKIGFFLSLNTTIEIGQTRKILSVIEAILICLSDVVVPFIKLLIALVKC